MIGIEGVVEVMRRVRLSNEQTSRARFGGDIKDYGAKARDGNGPREVEA